MDQTLVRDEPNTRGRRNLAALPSAKKIPRDPKAACNTHSFLYTSRIASTVTSHDRVSTVL